MECRSIPETPQILLATPDLFLLAEYRAALAGTAYTWSPPWTEWNA